MYVCLVSVLSVLYLHCWSCVCLFVQGTVAIVTLVTTSGYVIESTKQWNPMPAPGTFVEIEDDQGRPVSIHLQKKGSGAFTVVFDGGVGETSFDWDKVADQVRRRSLALALLFVLEGWSAHALWMTRSTGVSVCDCREHRSPWTRLLAARTTPAHGHAGTHSPAL